MADMDINKKDTDDDVFVDDDFDDFENIRLNNGDDGGIEDETEQIVVFPLEGRLPLPAFTTTRRKMLLITLGVALVLTAALLSHGSSKSTPDNRNPESSTSSPPIAYYSALKSDRSGQQVLQMFHVHAYIFALSKQTGTSAVYGGACADLQDWQLEHDRKGVNTTMQEYMAMEQKRTAVKKEMVASLGLQDELPFDCPTQNDLDSGQAVILDRNDFKSSGFDPEWVSYIQRHSAFWSYFEARLDDATNTLPLQVAVHVRRGDYNPCELPTKYLPNSYYTQILDLILSAYCGNATSTATSSNGRSCHVTIFSEDDIPPFEDFDIFQERQYSLDLNSSLPDIWAAFIKADVLVTSISSFSYAPAILNARGVVVNPGHGFAFLPGWITVGQDTVAGTETQSIWNHVQTEVNRLVELQCHP